MVTHPAKRRDPLDGAEGGRAGLARARPLASWLALVGAPRWGRFFSTLLHPSTDANRPNPTAPETDGLLSPVGVGTGARKDVDGGERTQSGAGGRRREGGGELAEFAGAGGAVILRSRAE